MSNLSVDTYFILFPLVLCALWCISQVFHRTSATQKAIRSKIAGALPTLLKNILKIDLTNKTAVAQLLDKNNYIYPFNDGVFILLICCSTTNALLFINRSTSTTGLSKGNSFKKVLQLHFLVLTIPVACNFRRCLIRPSRTCHLSSRSRIIWWLWLVPWYVSNHDFNSLSDTWYMFSQVHATLQGLLMGNALLPDFQFESVFQAHMTLMVYFRSRSHTAYHKRMHGIYQAVT